MRGGREREREGVIDREIERYRDRERKEERECGRRDIVVESGRKIERERVKKQR